MTTFPDYLKTKYEREIGEPWSELEKRVRARHPDFFEMYDALEPISETKRWWEFWK
jgi:hypothetical protein